MVDNFNVFKFADKIAEARLEVEDSLIKEGYFKDSWIEENIYNPIQPVCDFFFKTLLDMTEDEYYSLDEDISLPDINEELILYCSLRYWQIIKDIVVPKCFEEEEWKEIVLDRFTIVIDYLIDEVIPDRKIEYEDYFEMGLDEDEEKLKAMLGFNGNETKNKYWMDLEKEVDEWLQQNQSKDN